jgi:hypothetical protein
MVRPRLFNAYKRMTVKMVPSRARGRANRRAEQRRRSAAGVPGAGCARLLRLTRSRGAIGLAASGFESGSATDDPMVGVAGGHFPGDWATRDCPLGGNVIRSEPLSRGRCGHLSASRAKRIRPWQRSAVGGCGTASSHARVRNYFRGAPWGASSLFCLFSSKSDTRIIIRRPAAACFLST